MIHSSPVPSVGLIVKSTKIWRWQAELISALLDKGLMPVTVVLTQTEEPPVMPWQIAALHKTDSIIFNTPINAFEIVGLKSLGLSATETQSLSEMKAHPQPDYLINFSGQPVSDALLEIPKLALLETHFALDPKANALDSTHFGYTAFSNAEKQCYFAIRAKRLDGKSVVLAESYPSLDRGPLSRNLNQYWQLLEASWVRTLTRLQGYEDAFRQLASQQSRSSQVTQAMGRPKALKAYQNLASIFLDKFSQKFLRKEQWVLLLQFRQASANKSDLPLSFANYTVLSPPDDCFWADPFVVSEQDRHYVFFEELPFATERGHLSCMEVFADGKHTTPKTILKQPYHLSYPNVFMYDSTYYMVPESGDAGFIALYHSTDFPYEWEVKHSLIENIHAYDSTLLEYQGRWWLFACVAAEKGMSGNEELHIFSANSPLSQDWQAHPMNPVISDASRARPAGKFFEWEGRLYRPSQDCAGSYGAGLNINQVIILNDEHYEEKPTHCARPSWDPKLTALHTLNFNEHVSVADAMHVERRF